jgi:hypothetical protein
MLYRHEKPCFKKEKQNISELSLPTTISHIQCFPFDGLRVHLKGTHGFAYQIWNFPIPSDTFKCFMLSVQNMFLKSPSMSWPWDTRSSYRSIVSELLSLSFHAVTQNSQRKKTKLFMVTSRINLFRKEDHRELVKIVEDRCNPFPLFLPRNLGSRFL